eukprot:GDKK01011416.1.p1 GENE.GDKK01011416.1~~GDKK01011416.1.p1  ORF type:complete len:552 (+),score=111.31 GDKK01011416.1:1-1656(+)
MGHFPFSLFIMTDNVSHHRNLDNVHYQRENFPRHVKKCDAFQRGSCNFPNCRYAHVTAGNGLRDSYSSTRASGLNDSYTSHSIAGTNTPPENAYTKVCRYFLSGQCTRGDKCFYLHESEKHRSTSQSDASLNNNQRSDLSVDVPAIVSVTHPSPHLATPSANKVSSSIVNDKSSPNPSSNVNKKLRSDAAAFVAGSTNINQQNVFLPPVVDTNVSAKVKKASSPFISTSNDPTSSLSTAVTGESATCSASNNVVTPMSPIMELNLIMAHLPNLRCLSQKYYGNTTSYPFVDSHGNYMLSPAESLYLEIVVSRCLPVVYSTILKVRAAREEYISLEASMTSEEKEIGVSVKVLAAQKRLVDLKTELDAAINNYKEGKFVSSSTEQEPADKSLIRGPYFNQNDIAAELVNQTSMTNINANSFNDSSSKKENLNDSVSASVSKPSLINPPSLPSHPTNLVDSLHHVPTFAPHVAHPGFNSFLMLGPPQMQMMPVLPDGSVNPLFNAASMMMMMSAAAGMNMHAPPPPPPQPLSSAPNTVNNTARTPKVNEVDKR